MWSTSRSPVSVTMVAEQEANYRPVRQIGLNLTEPIAQASWRGSAVSASVAVGVTPPLAGVSVQE